MIERTFARVDFKRDPPAPYLNDEVKYPVAEEDANLVTSLTADGWHAPALDFDFPCRLVPSSTEDHFHLFIDQELTWEQYEALLAGLFAAGLIQQRWYALMRGFTALRHNCTKDA